MKFRRRQFMGLVGGGAAALAVAACTPQAPGPSPIPTCSALTDEHLRTLVEAVPKRSLGSVNMSRLAEGLTPPTNRWFSGLVFGDQAQPIFPLPLGWALVDGGFEMWLPEIAVSDKAIMGQRPAGLKVLPEGTSSAMVTGYDVASVAVELRASDGAGIVEVRIVQGSPIVTVKALRDTTITSPEPYATAGQGWAVDVADVSFGLVGGTADGNTVKLMEGETAVWFASPPGVAAHDLAGLAGAITQTSFGWDVEDESVTTTIDFGAETLFVTMPHHEDSLIDAGDRLGQYSSVFGALILRHGRTLSWRSARWPIDAALDVSGVDDAGRDQIAELAQRDVNQTRPFPTDSYFGGKALYREAQLVAVAKQVGVDASAMAKQVTDELLAWAQPAAASSRALRCFVYDDQLRGMVGLEPSFGSEEFNDHHFHYGYFLHAAGTMCADDPELAEQLAPVFDLLAADIASPQDNGLFPQLRCFDVYASHSWASGTAPFADGNNQESSSEAVNAWAGLVLWARARGDSELEAQANWMHALEAEAALAYWLQPDMSDFPEYGYRIVGIGWGAKRDYATWFSPDSMALLMIQVIPAGPGATYLANERDEIEATVAEAVGQGGFDRQYGDYCLMYQAVGDREAAASALPDIAEVIDDGMTATYATAFVLSRS